MNEMINAVRYEGTLDFRERYRSVDGLLVDGIQVVSGTQGPQPDGVELCLAGRIKYNIRELEGSLIRLLAYASLTGRQVSLELAHEVLRNVSDQDGKAVTIESIQKFVSDYYQLKTGELKSRNN